MDPISKTPTLVASTRATYSCSIAESKLNEKELLDAVAEESQNSVSNNGIIDESEVNYFKSAQWSPDGTALLTSSADNTIRTFILPPTLLDDPTSPLSLVRYSVHTHPTSINCISPYPHFALSEPSTTLYLSAPTDLPIRLINCLSQNSAPVSTYSLISPTTEAYQTPSSITWTSSGTHFLTGTDCLIALFDISRSGEGPSMRMPTIPSKRHKMKGGGVGIRGIVSALSLQGADGMLAAGTWTRSVGLYDMEGVGGTVATWSVADAADEHAGIGGTGITQTLWSACGRYLYVVERKSNGVLVYDVRVTGKLMAWLEGRNANTNQRLSVDMFEGKEGVEIWAGGTDGIVRVWEGVGTMEGSLERSWEWAAHDDPISSTVLHNSGSVIATCSGQRAEPAIDDDNDSTTSSDEESSEDEEDQSTKASSDASSRASSVQTPGTMRRIPDNSIKSMELEGYGVCSSVEVKQTASDLPPTYIPEFINPPLPPHQYEVSNTILVYLVFSLRRTPRLRSHGGADVLSCECIHACAPQK